MADLARSKLHSLKNRRLDHDSLRSYMRVGLRRGTWRKLDAADKALYRCGLWVAGVRGKISNVKLSAIIFGIIIKLMTTIKSRIYRLGLARARVLWNNYLSSGVFEWAPEAKAQFSRHGYIAYLGVMELNC